MTFPALGLLEAQELITKRPELLRRFIHSMDDEVAALKQDIAIAETRHRQREELLATENEHHPSQLTARWPVVKPLLEQAGWCRKLEIAKGGAIALPAVKPSERFAC